MRHTLVRSAFYPATAALALAIGALQMLHVRGGWLTNYGADLFRHGLAVCDVPPRPIRRAI